MKESKLLTAIDLFSGCGGLTQGLKQAGFHVIGAVEIDLLSAESYKANHAGVELWQEDIRKISGRRLMRRLSLRKGELDLLAGCPPCQGFSSLRTLNGGRRVLDTRNDLIFEFLRLVQDLRPKSVMMENVPGLSEDRRFSKFCKSLQAMGYVGEFRILNVANYGVPQRRRRLLYMAGLKGCPEFARPRNNIRTVKQAIGKLPVPGHSGDPVHDIPENRSLKVRALIKKVPKNGGSRSDLSKRYQLDCHKSCNGFHDVYGRMAWNDVSPTITSGCFNPSKGRFLHPIQDRAITMREAAILQSFPRRYRFPSTGNKSAIAAMIGNALPPAFVASHAKKIKQWVLSNSR